MAKDKPTPVIKTGTFKRDSGLSKEAQEALKKLINLKGESVDSSGKPLKKRKPKPKPKIGSGEQHKRSNVSITRNKKYKVGSPTNTKHVLPKTVGDYDRFIGKDALKIIKDRISKGKN